ncbi:hypothetical protein F1B92_00145 [Campylobacter sp. FMV-PI01]|uniref:Uncharacterized protein n=1 Tax=Campylobacter portucalensis TaxID=2608384 RepID=A0A6L5WGY8_9BACT|nr:hypothetical protein [Campylobacter portucalensis]MSN95622.1 hypothetical protein [Campylobacter portucalensis]
MEEILLKHKIFLKKTKTINLKLYTRAKSYKVIVGVDMQSNNLLLVFRDAKSRFLQKNGIEVAEFSNMILKDLDIISRKKIFFYNSEICSKALKLMEENGFKCCFAM